MKPRLLLTKVGRRWFRRFPTEANKRFARDTFRKWCVRDELPNLTNEGFQMRVSPHDYMTYGIFFFGEYDVHMTSFIKAHIPEGAVCWDVGAQTGWFSLLMARLVGPTGRVDAFEPFPANYSKLVNNIALNEYTSIQAHKVAVSDKKGHMNFVPPSDEVTHHVGFLEDCSGVGYLSHSPQAGTIVVPTTTLDQHAEETGTERLDFIKMDIEGAELAAFHGARQVLRDCRPKLGIEYNRECARRAGTSIEELDSLLDDFGYDRFTFWGRLRKLRIEEWEGRPDSETVFNVYCFPRP